MKKSQPLLIKKSVQAHDNEHLSSDDSLLSKSLGAAPRLAEMSSIHRRSSEGSQIRYSGYLMKRSNKPYRELSDFPISNNSLASTPRSQPLRDVSVGDCDLPQQADTMPQHLVNSQKEAPHIAAVAGSESQESEELQRSPMERSLLLISNFFGCDNDVCMAERRTQLDIHGNQRGPNLVTPDQFVPNQPSSERANVIGRAHGATPLPVPQPSNDSPAPVLFERYDSSPAVLSGSRMSPPVDFVDKDGHIWRSKYCVLEYGSLFFYRSVSEGECAEAQAERRKSTSVIPENSACGMDDMSDLSKSPMPRARLLPVVGSGQRVDSNQVGDGSSVIWEKRVQLDRVGEVRSAELEYGEYAFELLAVNSENRRNEEIDGTSPSHQDRLILRARNSDEMNEWFFQCLRSLVSFMKNIVEAVESHHGYPAIGPMQYAPAGDIHHPYFGNNSLIASIPPPLMDGFSGPISAHSLSPAGRFRPQPSFATSLSHGHGRNRRHRRQEPEEEHVSALTLAHAQSNEQKFSPLPMIEASQQPPRKVTPTSAAKRADVHSLDPVQEHAELKLRGDEDTAVTSQAVVKNDIKSPQLSAAATSRSKGKYIPPHLRNKKNQDALAGNRRGVPPHLHKQADDTDDSGDLPFEIEEESQLVSLRDRESGVRYEQDGRGADDGAFELSPDDSYTPQINGVRENGDSMQDSPTLAVKLGGCADPMVAVGSILDISLYKSRKASRIGKVHTDAFGCFGGGPATLQSSADVGNVAFSDSQALRWEIGAVSECGIRDSNEDSYLIASDLIKTFDETREGYGVSISMWTKSATHRPGLFAIFDGHCENQAARYAAEKLVDFIMEESMNMPTESSAGPKEIQEVLTRAFASLDDSFCRLCTADGRDWDSGTTALIAILVQDQLVVANLGDCRAVMSCSVPLAEGSSSEHADHSVLKSEGWTALELEYGEAETDSKWIRATGDGAGDTPSVCLWKEVTEIHHPARDDERRRIEEANGWITTEKEIPISQLQRMDFCDEDVVEIVKRCFSDRYQSSQDLTPSKRYSAAPQRVLVISRVCGELAVSRALGDRDFKAAFNPPSVPAVDPDSNRVDVSSRPESPDDVSWDCSLFLPYPDDHNKRFVGDLVSAVPEVQELKVGQKGVFEEFLLLACDGLWDVMDPDDAVRVTRGLLFEKKWSAKKAAARLAEIAIHLGSSDNITVIVIRLFREQMN